MASEPSAHGATNGPSTDTGTLDTALRDLIHYLPITQCSVSSDTCPDWPLAHELARLIRAGNPDIAMRTLVCLCDTEAVPNGR